MGEGVEERFEVRHDGLDRQVGDRCRVGAQGFDLDVESGVGGGVHGEALGFVAALPVLPRARGDPEAVDQHDGVGGGGHDRPLMVGRRLRQSAPSPAATRLGCDIITTFDERISVVVTKRRSRNGDRPTHGPRLITPPRRCDASRPPPAARSSGTRTFRRRVVVPAIPDAAGRHIPRGEGYPLRYSAYYILCRRRPRLRVVIGTG